MSCTGVKIQAHRNADFRVTYQPASRNYSFATFEPVFTVRRGADALLTVTSSATANGSVFSVVDDAIVLTLEKTDLALLDSASPDTSSENLNYDVVLIDGSGFENWTLGGQFILLGLNEVGACSSCGDVEVMINGQCVDVTVEGGNIGAGASVLLADLNAAVESASESAEEAALDAQQAAAAQVAAQQAATDAQAAADSIPGMLVNLALTDGSNTIPEGFGQNLGLRRVSATVAAANPAAGLDAVSPQLMTRGQSVQVDLPAGTVNVTSPVAWQHPMSQAIKLRGVAPTSTTIVSIDSVTGSAGAWVVTATVSDASGIAIGDGIALRNMVPGWSTPGAYAARQLVAGEGRMQFFASGAFTSSGTTGTAASGTNATYLANGNLIGILGEIRQISAVAASTFTMNAALASNAPSTQYWYAVKEMAGTCTVATTTVTGTGTSFLTTANVGDQIWFKGFGVRRITAVNSNTSLTLDRAITIGSGTEYGMMTCAWRHEGAFLVTAVSGNQVTWVNYNRSAQSQPPVNLVSGGDMTIYKTVFNVTGSAFQIEGGNVLDIDNVFLYGPTGSTTCAFDLRGSDGESAGHLTLGPNVAVARFGYGIFSGVGSRIYAVGSHWSGQTTRGINLATAAWCNANAARVSGVNAIGIFIGDGAYCRHNAAIVTGCGDDGMRTEVGGSNWGDFSVATHNGAKGYHWVGGTMPHLVGSWSFANTEEGYIGENGGYGRMTGFFALSNSVGISSGGHIECQQAFLSGNGNNLIATASASVNANNVGASYPAADNFQAIGGGAVISVTNARVIGAADDGLATSLGGYIYGSATVFAANPTDAESVTQGQIKLSSAVGLTTTVPTTRNRYAADGGLVADGTAVIGQDWVDSSGAPGVVTAVPTATKTLIQQFTVPGVTVNNCRGFSIPSDNVGALDNVSFTAEVTAADTVGIYGIQWSGASVNVGNRTWYLRTYIA